MGIRLLKKDEISKLQGADRAKEVSEGLKLSRRVDSLRELQAKEEESLEKFRNESLSAITAEINRLFSKKEDVESELHLLEEKAKKELSKTDKKRLEDLKESLDKREKEIKEKSFELDLKEVDIACAEKEVKDSLARQKTQEETAVLLHRKSAEEKSEAERLLSNAQTIEERAIKAKNQFESEMEMKSAMLEQKEKEIAMKDEENLDRERELAVEKIQLADQRATLERALARIKQNRL